MDEMTGPSDSALLDQFIGGDVPAFERLVARYEKRVFNFIRRMIGPSDEAEDLTQETFIRVYERAGTLRRRGAFRPWLWSIAANLCRDHFKRRRYRNHLSIEDGVDPEREPALSVSADRRIDEAEVGRIVARAIRALNPDIRMAIVLREYEGLSYEEIAEAAGCPLGTVRSRLFAARRELRKQLSFLLEE